MGYSVWAIGGGAAAGALLRWWLGLALNGVLVELPLGTLAANLLGGYLMGVAVGVFSLLPQIPAEWRLLIMTGFLGGLTTFSTFSAEAVTLLQGQRYGWALLHVLVHVICSLCMTVLGLMTVRALQAH